MIKLSSQINLRLLFVIYSSTYLNISIGKKCGANNVQDVLHHGTELISAEEQWYPNITSWPRVLVNTGTYWMIFLFVFGCGFISGIIFLACLSVLVAKEFDKKEKWWYRSKASRR